MKESINNYKIFERLYKSPNSLIYRAEKLDDHTPVILKVLQPENPSPEQLSRFRNEYEITKSFQKNGIIRAHCLEEYDNTLMIVEEDIAASSLNTVMQNRRLSLSESLLIAVKITESLSYIHSVNIIHKDLNPSNIIWNPHTEELNIIDFGIASRLSSESTSLKVVSVIEGTLAYISPEQTGRINRNIDYRTDLYSLGVVLYKMFTGQLPFKTTDSMELIYSHIAKTPIIPSTINSEMQEILSNIVMKLLEKNAEDRYQSSLGVKADLEKCLKHLKNNKDLKNLQFELEVSDFSGKLQIPQKLYGRENQVKTLFQAFQRVSSGKAELMLVSGYSGVGKTALVHEVHKPMTQKRGYFASGKFDQLTKGIPYYAITQAFNQLCRYLLMESYEKLANWKNKIIATLGSNGQIIIDVIPDLELVIGKQPPVEKVGPTETQNRFQIFFINFIKSICDKDHPFILFIDDLQWIDSASLSLLKAILMDDEIRYLLVIGAYRNNEVDNNHPLITEIDTVRKENAIINEIVLENLHLDNISQLMQETLNCKKERSQSLVDLIYHKTLGNAFFTHQFLQNLYENNLLQFNLELKQWQWDVEKIRTMNITNNVVELMIDKVDKLPDRSSTLLKLAACIGNQFSLSTLSIIAEQQQDETLKGLQPALIEGLILPLDKKFQFKFLHDKIQQAAYELVIEDHKKGVHLTIGRLLVKQFSEKEIAENIFQVVKHFNSGIDLLEDHEKVQLAEFNLSAAIKAKKSAAYALGLQYLKKSKSLLHENSWQDHYKLTFTIFKETAETEYVLSNFEQMETLVSIILNHAKTKIEKAQIYNLLILKYTLQLKYAQAIQAGRDALNFLDVRMPDNNFHDAAIEECEALIQKLAGKDIQSLINNNKMPSEEISTALFILSTIIPTAYQTDINLCKWIGAKGLDLSIKHGWIIESTMFGPAFGFYPILNYNNYRMGYKYASLSISISEKFQSKSEKCKAVETTNSHFNIWVSPLYLTNKLADDGILAGIESGEIQYASYTMLWQSFNSYYQGLELSFFLKELKRFSQHFHRTRDQLSLTVALLETFAIQDILVIDEKSWLANSIKDLNGEEQYVNECTKREAFLPLCLYYVFKLHTSYILNNYTLAYEFSLDAQKLKAYIPLSISVAECNFYGSLTLTAIYYEASKKKQIIYLKQLEDNQEQMKIWADSCPENFLNMYILVDAEIARIKGDTLKAMDLYDQAIALAHEHKFIQNEAIGNELGAKLWMHRGKKDFAKLYLKKAYYCYNQWGATRKVNDLKEKYPQFLSDTTASSTSASSSKTELDIGTIIKASQAISSEIQLTNLITSMLSIIIENAGAQKGVLLLEEDGKLQVVAITNNVHDIVHQIKTISLESCENVSKSIVNFVKRTKEVLVLDSAIIDEQFKKDPYIIKNKVKSVLCTPIITQAQTIGIIYLENNLITGTFSPERFQVVSLLAAQAGISLVNAKLFEDKKKYAEELTIEVTEREQAQHEITRLRNYLSNIINSMPSILVGVDHNNMITQWNNMVEQTTGVSQEDAVNRPLVEVIPSLSEESDRISKAIKTRSVQSSMKQTSLKAGKTRQSHRSAQTEPLPW